MKLIKFILIINLIFGVAGCSIQNITTEDSTLTQTSGNFLGHDWYISQNKVMYWDKQPYIPYTSFAIAPGNRFGINDFHFWLDNDSGEFQDPVFVDNYTTQITSNGGTYTVLIMKGMPGDFIEGKGYDASKLFDDNIKEQIINSWKPFASAIKKEGLRAIFLWNEIDVDFFWPSTYTYKQYGEKLNEYAQEMKKLVGDVPVIFKSTHTFQGEDFFMAFPVINAASIGAGLGMDIYSPECPSSNLDALYDFNQKLTEWQDKTSLLWISEFGVGNTESTSCYWDNFPPFNSKSEMRCHIETYINNGATGFIYAGPADGPLEGDCNHLDYSDSHKWFFEMRDEMIQKIITDNN